MTTPSKPIENVKKLVGFIDMTPTWEEILPTYLVILRDGNAQGQRSAIEELTRMAKLADAYVAEHKNDAKG